MSSSQQDNFGLISYSNHFYHSLKNTEVGVEQIYTASQGKQNLSVIRQVSGVVTIPSGYVFTSGATGYLPIIEDGTTHQLIVPINSIVKKVQYSAVPFQSLETLLKSTTTTILGFTSTTAYTTTIPYTAGFSLSTSSIALSLVNNNIMATPADTGRPTSYGLFGVAELLNTSLTYTTTQANKIRVTVYYSEGQDLNN